MTALNPSDKSENMRLSLPGWSATSRDHWKRTWPPCGAGVLLDAVSAPPLRDIFNQKHDVRIQLFSPESTVDAAAFVTSFYGRYKTQSRRLMELTWEFSVPSRDLWSGARNLMKVTIDQGGAAGGKQMSWAIEDDSGMDSGDSISFTDVPAVDEIKEGGYLCLAFGDVELNTLAVKLGMPACIASVLWPADAISFRDLGIPRLVIDSKPKNFNGASAADLARLLDDTLPYLAVAPLTPV